MNRRTFLHEMARNTAGGAVATFLAGCTAPLLQAPEPAARDLPDTSTQQDVLVIGSGPIGMGVARRLAEDGRRVLLLEGGPAITTPPGSHLRNEARFQANPDAFFAGMAPYLTPASTDPDTPLPGLGDSSVLGGQGILWTNNCPRATEMERWDALTPDQWEAKYAEAEALLAVDPDPAPASTTGERVQAQLAPALAAAGRQMHGLPFAGRMLDGGQIHFNSPADILDATTPEARARIDLHTGIHVARLQHTGSRITGVEVRDANQTRRTLPVSLVVVAGGALATPKLLHASGIRPEALASSFSMHALLSNYSKGL